MDVNGATARLQRVADHLGVQTITHSKLCTAEQAVSGISDHDRLTVSRPLVHAPSHCDDLRRFRVLSAADVQRSFSRL